MSGLGDAMINVSVEECKDSRRAKIIISGRGLPQIVEVQQLDVDAIEDVKINKDNMIIYDLQGRKVQVPSHGLYIINGKKIIIK